MTSRLLDDQFHALTRLKRSSIEHYRRGQLRRLLFSRKKESAINSIMNRACLNPERAEHGFSYILGIGEDCIRLANGAARKLGCLSIHNHDDVSNHGGFQSELTAQREEEIIQRAESRVEVNVGS